MLNTTDVTGVHIALEEPAKRIVSLVPSTTETLIAVAGPSVLVGRTRYCIHPAEEVSGIPTVGGTKNPLVEQIIELKPDLVLANHEENLPEHVGALREAGVLVHVSEPRTVHDALDQIMLAGAATGEIGAAMERFNQGVAVSEALRVELEERRAVDAARLRPRGRCRVAVLIWREPWMVAGGDTFIHGMLDTLGLENVFADESRYPEKSMTELREAAPELILLPSEPWKFGESDREELTALLSDLPGGPVPAMELVGGEDLMWPGSRTPEALVRLWEQLGKWAR